MHSLYYKGLGLGKHRNTQPKVIHTHNQNKKKRETNRQDESFSMSPTTEDLVIGVTKKTGKHDLGIRFRRTPAFLFVSEIHRSSPFRKTQLSRGMEILVINGVQSSSLNTVKEAYRLLIKATGTVTLLAKKSNEITLKALLSPGMVPRPYPELKNIFKGANISPDKPPLKKLPVKRRTRQQSKVHRTAANPDKQLFIPNQRRNMVVTEKKKPPSLADKDLSPANQKSPIPMKNSIANIQTETFTPFDLEVPLNSRRSLHRAFSDLTLNRSNHYNQPKKQDNAPLGKIKSRLESKPFSANLMKKRDNGKHPKMNPSKEEISSHKTTKIAPHSPRPIPNPQTKTATTKMTSRSARTAVSPQTKTKADTSRPSPNLISQVRTRSKKAMNFLPFVLEVPLDRRLSLQRGISDLTMNRSNHYNSPRKQFKNLERYLEHIGKGIFQSRIETKPVSSKSNSKGEGDKSQSHPSRSSREEDEDCRPPPPPGLEISSTALKAHASIRAC
jgi:hypothetical protein